MKKYKHHKYIWTNRFGMCVNHNWELVGPNGAINFHVSIMKDEKYGMTAGLEFHHLEGEGAPDHVNCPLTGGRCWHDGTSLYATETVWPIVAAYLTRGDHESIFAYLEDVASDHFDKPLLN